MSRLSPAALEPVKWLAFVAMVADHVDLILFDRSLPVLHQLGRFAYPAFALCFGIGLANASDAVRIAQRLVLPCLAAQFAWFVFDPSYPVNVLGVFLLCAIVAATWQRDRTAAFIVAGLVVAATPLLEGGFLGPLAVAGGFAAARLGRQWPVALSVAPWIVLAPSAGLVAAVAAPFVASASPIAIPRVRGLLAWGYPAHLALLVALAGPLP